MKKNELKKQREYYNQRLKEQDDYRKENNIEDNELNEVNEKDELKKEKIDEKISELNEEISKLTEEKSYNQNQIELLESNLETVFDIENEIEELNQKIEEMQVNCNILEKTKKYLETAKNQFSSRYLGEMIESFNNNLKLISGQNMNTNLDVKLNVKINEQGSNKDLKYFSTGYKDLIYICMRLSLIDSLFKEEKPFIILDDPFVNLDKTKTKKAIDLLKDIAKRYQIIYFICHESRK